MLQIYPSLLGPQVGMFTKSGAIADHLINLLSPAPFVPWYLFFQWPNKTPTLHNRTLLLLRSVTKRSWRKSHAVNRTPPICGLQLCLDSHCYQSFASSLVDFFKSFSYSSLINPGCHSLSRPSYSLLP